MEIDVVLYCDGVYVKITNIENTTSQIKMSLNKFFVLVVPERKQNPIDVSGSILLIFSV